MLDSASLCRSFCFYLLPGFSLQAFSSAVEALDIANEVMGRNSYRWHVVSDHGHAVVSDSGVSVCSDESLESQRGKPQRLSSAPIIIVAGGRGIPEPHKQLEAWLRECRNRRARVVGIAGGTIVLARAGLAEGRRCAVHWEQFPVFRERFREVIARQTNFEFDGDLYTCAGGRAPFDMFLSIIDLDHDSSVVGRICEKAIASQVRSAGDRQRVPFQSRVGVNPVVVKIVDQMEFNIADPLKIDYLAALVNLSRRQVERLFKREFGCSPSRYYLNLRLEHAHLLLTGSPMPIVDIAIASGFVSASHFSSAYRDRHGCAPHQSRLGISQRRRGRPNSKKLRTTP